MSINDGLDPSGDCVRLESAQKAAMTRDCNSNVASRVTDECVLEAIQNLDPAASPVKTKTYFNEIITTADTEQSLVLPALICGYFIRTRGKSILKLSHTLGESGTLYQEIPMNSAYTDSHSFANLTLYFQSPNAGEVVEIITWS